MWNSQTLLGSCVERKDLYIRRSMRQKRAGNRDATLEDLPQQAQSLVICKTDIGNPPRRKFRISKLWDAAPRTRRVEANRGGWWLSRKRKIHQRLANMPAWGQVREHNEAAVQASRAHWSPRQKGRHLDYKQELSKRHLFPKQLQPTGSWSNLEVVLIRNNGYRIVTCWPDNYSSTRPAWRVPAPVKRGGAYWDTLRCSFERLIKQERAFKRTWRT